MRIGEITLPVNRIHIELTNICNFSCEFCPDGMMKRPRGRMPTEMVKEIINEVSRYSIARDLYFHVMGEPTLHPDLVTLSRYAADRDLRVCITTNGSLLDMALYRELKAAGIKQLFISLQTPDEESFRLRGTKTLNFNDYAERILKVSLEHLKYSGEMELIIGFLSSPLRRLIIPIVKEISIADTTKQLKNHLRKWAEMILQRAGRQELLAEAIGQINRVRSFRENVIVLGRRVKFMTRVLGDWKSVTARRRNRARFGFCHGLQENFGILYNGDYTYCCTDFDGMTSRGNFGEMGLVEYLSDKRMQEVVRGFKRYRVIDPYCQHCLGDYSLLNTIVKQFGSILYFKFLRKI